jgi:hypothetical protein
MLDELPRMFTPDLYQQKCELVYQHVDSYSGQGKSLYASKLSKKRQGNLSFRRQMHLTNSPKLLFDVLLDFPKSAPKCPCGETNDLLLIPPFAFGAGGSCFKVLDALHEIVSWKDKGKRITFYPFLVVLESTEDKSRKIWLHYWHVEETRRKFGERAPWMDADLFCGLLAKAHAKGYLRESS